MRYIYLIMGMSMGLHASDQQQWQLLKKITGTLREKLNTVWYTPADNQQYTVSQSPIQHEQISGNQISTQHGNTADRDPEAQNSTYENNPERACPCIKCSPTEATIKAACITAMATIMASLIGGIIALSVTQCN